MIRRLAAEGAALLLLALACAWISNGVASPARHLSWFPKTVRRVTPPPALPAPAPGPAVAPALPPPAAKPEAKKALAPVPKTDPEAGLLARFPPLADAPQAEISSEDAGWLHGHGAVFLDARRTAIWTQGHIRGAKVISVWEDGLAEKVEELAMFARDLKLPVVIYCSGGDCRDSHLLAEKLWLAGFRNLRIYSGGYPDWEARGWPVAKGDAP